jgi:hypothetical protein
MSGPLEPAAGLPVSGNEDARLTSDLAQSILSP